MSSPTPRVLHALRHPSGAVCQRLLPRRLRRPGLDRRLVRALLDLDPGIDRRQAGVERRRRPRGPNQRVLRVRSVGQGSEGRPLFAAGPLLRPCERAPCPCPSAASVSCSATETFRKPADQSRESRPQPRDRRSGNARVVTAQRGSGSLPRFRNARIAGRGPAWVAPRVTRPLRASAPTQLGRGFAAATAATSAVAWPARSRRVPGGRSRGACSRARRTGSGARRSASRSR
jgi:hypothetical protein